MSFKIMDNFDLGNVFWMFFQGTLFTINNVIHNIRGKHPRCKPSCCEWYFYTGKWKNKFSDQAK
jgi:hypothetical protein